MLTETRDHSRRSLLLPVAALLFALLLAACGGGDDEADGGTDADGSSTTAVVGDDDPETAAGGEQAADGEDDTDTSAEADGDTSTGDEDEEATSAGDGAAGGGEAVDGEGAPVTGITTDPTEDPVPTELLDRFAEALPVTGDEEFVITADDGRCAAEGLDGRLSEADYEVLTERIENNESIEAEDGLGTSEIEVIANVFAVCLDVSPILPDFIGDLGPGSEPLVACLETEVGEQGLEEALLFEVLADNLQDVGSRFYVVGLEVCPDEARSTLGAVSADWVDVSYDEELAMCLDEVPITDYEQFVADGGPFGFEVAESFLADNCGV